jgi:hypothetical protein
MNSLLSLLNDPRLKDDVDPVLPWPKTEKDRPSPLTSDAGHVSSSTTSAPEQVDVSAEETCPAPSPAPLPSQAPFATTFALMNHLDTLAQDLAAAGRSPGRPVPRASSEQSAGTMTGQDEPSFTSEARASEVRVPEVQAAKIHVPEAPVPELQVPEAPMPKVEPPKVEVDVEAVEPSIHVPPRVSDFDSLTAHGSSKGRRTAVALASLSVAALMGLGATYAWQSHRLAALTSPNDGSASNAPAAPAAQAVASQGVVSGAPSPQSSTPAAQPAAGPVAPEVAKQLEAMAQDLILVRRGVEQLAAKQEQLAAAQQQLEQLAAKQGQLAAKQDQLAQSIAKLQPREQSVRPKMSSPPPQSRAASIPPRTFSEPVVPPPPPPPAPAARSSESHPTPPLPVPR